MENAKKYSCQICGRLINHEGNCFKCNINRKKEQIKEDYYLSKKENTEKEEVVENSGSESSGIKIYSVDEITTHIKNILEQNNNLQNIWVRGEISNLRSSDKGHMYFSLKDENSIIDCAMFQRANQNLKFAPEEGMKILVRGSIELYKLRGRYQIIVEEICLTGKGELYLKYLQLKSKLEKEGLFKESHKKSIPKYPKSIGVVTSLQGAVIHDIIKVIKRRYPHIKILIYPSLVQGNEAKYEIVKGIEKLNKLDIELIIIARGGGSFEELWPFNEEIVARAIYNSKKPIVSAVGHETDYTIADFVADKRAPTPSAAAEIIVPNEQELLMLLKNLEKRLCKQALIILERKKQTIKLIATRPIFKKPYVITDVHKQRLDDNKERIKQIIINKVEILKRDLKGMHGKLNALNPYAILGRGYSITMKKDKILLSTKDINTGDVISTIIKGGKINSKVQSKDETNVI